MEAGLWELLLDSFATLVTLYQNPVQELVSTQEIRLAKIQHVIKVVKKIKFVFFITEFSYNTYLN